MYKQFLTRENTVPLLVLFSTVLLWMDNLPRAVAVAGYPVWRYDPLVLNQWIPGKFAGTLAIASYMTAAVGFIFTLKSIRYGCMVISISIVIFLSIYWSFFPEFSHGGNLTLICAITTCLFILLPHEERAGAHTAYVFALQLAIALMFASAAYYKWTGTGWSWSEGIEMQKRVFASYSVDGRPYSIFARAIMKNVVVARLAGVMELVTQTAVLPLLILSLWIKKARILCFVCALMASMGIHVGMALFLFQHLPLVLILLVQSDIIVSLTRLIKKKVRRSPSIILTISCFVFITCANMYVSFMDKGTLKRGAYPLCNYPMFSGTFPNKHTHWRVETSEDLSSVQREFFLLFSPYMKWPRKDIDAFASAHDINVEQLQAREFRLSDWENTKTGAPRTN